jgi:7-cyano-7-deazaguanine synthase in queuosine biosynthesis
VPCAGNNNNQMKLIIDTDAGGDDAVAILLLLRNKNIDVIAITCVYGNTDEPNVEYNVLKILTIANRTDVSLIDNNTLHKIFIKRMFITNKLFIGIRLFYFYL